MRFFVLRNGNIVGDFTTREDALEYREYMQHRCAGDFTVVSDDVIDINDTFFEQSCEDDMYMNRDLDDDLVR